MPSPVVPTAPVDPALSTIKDKPSDLGIKPIKDKDSWIKAKKVIGPHLCRAWLGILIYGSDFWDPHRKGNSDSVFDSRYSGRNSFLNSTVEKSSNRNSDSKIWNSEFDFT